MTIHDNASEAEARAVARACVDYKHNERLHIHRDVVLALTEERDALRTENERLRQELETARGDSKRWQNRAGPGYQNGDGPW